MTVALLTGPSIKPHDFFFRSYMLWDSRKICYFDDGEQSVYHACMDEVKFILKHFP